MNMKLPDALQLNNLPKLPQTINKSAQDLRRGVAKGDKPDVSTHAQGSSDGFAKATAAKQSSVQKGGQNGAQLAGLYKGVAKYIFGRAGEHKDKGLRFKALNTVVNQVENHGILGLALRGTAAAAGLIVGGLWSGKEGAKALRDNLVSGVDHASELSRTATQVLPQLGITSLGFLGGALYSGAANLSHVAAVVGANVRDNASGGLKGIGAGVIHDLWPGPTDESSVSPEAEKLDLSAAPSEGDDSARKVGEKEHQD